LRGKPCPSGQDGAGGVAALGFSCRVCCSCHQADALIDSEKSFLPKTTLSKSTILDYRLRGHHDFQRFLAGMASTLDLCHHKNDISNKIMRSPK